MKKLFSSILLFAFISYSIFAATDLPYKPYAAEEFPSWAHKLRRAEVIAFGATALTYPLVGLATNSVFNDSDTSDFLKKMGISISLGAVIALIDYVIGETGK